MRPGRHEARMAALSLVEGPEAGEDEIAGWGRAVLARHVILR